MTEKTLNFEEFTELVEEHQSALRAFIYMQGIASDQVDDIAQDTFMTAFKQISSFEKGTYFLSWVRAIARNLILNELRKKNRRSRIMNAYVVEAMTVDDPKEQELFADEQVDAMRSCIEELPAHNRELIKGRYTDDQNSSKLAEQFKRSAVAIRQALWKVRAVLKDCVEMKLGKI